MVLQFTSAGIPVVCWGDEVARPGGDWPDNRSDMPWGDRPIPPGSGRPRDEAMRAEYKKVIAIRRAHPALSRGFHTGLSTVGNLLVFSQIDTISADAVVVAINRGAAPASATFKVPGAWAGSAVEDAMTGVSFPAPGDSMTTTVAAKSARILVGQARAGQQR
jgi:alpha-amylase